MVGITTMNVTPDLSDDVALPILQRCDCDTTQAVLDKWTDEANTLHYSFKRLISLHSDVLWSTVVYNDSFLKSFDAAVEAIPKVHDIDLFHLFFNWDEAASRAARNLRTTLLAVYLRLAVHNKQLDGALSQKQWIELVRDRSVMPFRRAAALWAHFPTKTDIFIKTLSHWATFDSKLRMDVSALAGNAKKSYQQLESDVRRLLDAFCTAEGPRRLRIANLVEEFFHLVVDLFYSNQVAVKVLHGARLLNDNSVRDWLSGIPSLVETTVRCFPVEIIFDVAMTLTSYPLKRLLYTVAQLEQSGADLFHQGLQMFSSLGDKFASVQAALNMERFVFVFNERHNLTHELSALESEQRQYVETAVEAICIAQTGETLKRLERYGLLEDLGDLSVMTAERSSAVSELMDLLPHLSPQYAHLCLRHFNYSVPNAVESLLSCDARLPMDLRRVEAAELAPCGQAATSLPPISYQDQDLVISALVRPTSSTNQRKKSVEKPSDEAGSRNVFKGLFSLAPPVQKPAETVPSDQNGSQPKVSEVLLQLRAALDRLKLRADGQGDEFQPQEGPNGERLVPMMAAKKYAGIKKFKTSDADKVAVRPTYERYKYETAGDDDVYDDEYDDGFEQREFQVEPLNAALSSSSEDEEGGKGAGGAMPNGTAPAVGYQNGARGRGRGRGRGGAPPPQRGGGAPFCGRTDAGGRGGASNNQPPQGAPEAGAGGGSSRQPAYTGGRDRQKKERNKNAFKQRGADRKMRGAPF